MPPAPNPRATASLLVGFLALVAVPAGVVLSRYSVQVTLINSTFVSVPIAILLGLYAIVLARRGRETLERTLGRSGGGAAARLGRVLGLTGLCVGITAGMALGFYGLLTLFAQ